MQRQGLHKVTLAMLVPITGSLVILQTGVQVLGLVPPAIVSRATGSRHGVCRATGGSHGVCRGYRP